MAWPNNNIVQLMQGEALSNGGWNAVLSLIFPCPAYLVAPKLTMTPRRFDFAVFSVAADGVFFAFEGKGNNFNWDNLAAEVRQCCEAIRPPGYQGYTYGMGGRGPDCIIVEWDGANLAYLDVDGQGNIVQRQNRVTFHVMNNQNAIVQILQEIRRIH